VAAMVWLKEGWIRFVKSLIQFLIQQQIKLPTAMADKTFYFCNRIIIQDGTSLHLPNNLKKHYPGGQNSLKSSLQL